MESKVSAGMDLIGQIVAQEFENSINKSGPSMGEASRPRNSVHA